MSIIQGTAKASGDASFYDFPIGQSLRFDGTSRLTKSQSSSNSNWTMSLWVKLSNISSTQYLFATGTASPNNWTSISWYPNVFNYGLNNGSGASGVLSHPRLYRDLSAWYHIVIDLGSTANMWINGVLVGTDSNPDAGNLNTTDPMEIGSLNNGEKFNGYLAEINFIDGYKTGTTLATYSDFGETKTVCGFLKNINRPVHLTNTARTGLD